jgi:HEAT repeat protein
MAVIRELIDRMKGGDFHKARAEAAAVRDLAALEQIREILEPTKDVTEKTYCYWILGDLGRNTKAPQVADYLMERVAAEKQMALRKLALDQVSLLQDATQADNALAAIGDKSRDVRYAAIRALGACRDARCEPALIGLVDADEDAVATRHAVIALARIGTNECSKSLAALFRRLPRDRRHEVTVAAALLALARNGVAEALPLAMEELGASKSEFVNWACMLVIRQHGDERQIDAVVDRLTTLLAKKKRQDMTYVINLIDTPYGDEFTAGVSFLRQFNDDRVGRFLADLREKPERLFDREKEWLAATN